MKCRKAIEYIIRKKVGFLSFLLFFIAGNEEQVVAQSTEKLYLSGTGNDKTVSWDFYCTGGMNAGKWTTIGVPSCWELQGFGKYDYGFAKDSVRGKEQGMYKYRFRVPRQLLSPWAGPTLPRGLGAEFEHPLQRPLRAFAHLFGQFDLVTQVFQRIERAVQRDHLHVAAELAGFVEMFLRHFQ